MNIDRLFDIIQSRKQNMPVGSYTTSLFQDGLPRIAQKVGEEGTEVVVAALAQDDRRLIEEISEELSSVISKEITSSWFS